MNNTYDDSTKTTRRRFNKTLAAALIATPISVSNIAGQTRRDPPAPCAATPTSPLLNEPCPAPGGPASEPHEPPIGFGGGSFTLECEEEMHREDDVEIPPRKYLYDFEKYTYGRMKRLEVVTEYDSIFTYNCYNLMVDPKKKVTNPKLKIWLQRLRRLDHGSDYEWIASDIDPATEPHIFLTYRHAQGEYAAVIESDKKFGEVKKGFKEKETFKHKHGGYGSTRFRIGRWSLINGDGLVLAGNCAGLQPVPGASGSAEVLGFHLRARFVHLADKLRLGAKERP